MTPMAYDGMLKKDDPVLPNESRKLSPEYARHDGPREKTPRYEQYENGRLGRSLPTEVDNRQLLRAALIYVLCVNRRTHKTENDNVTSIRICRQFQVLLSKLESGERRESQAAVQLSGCRAAYLLPSWRQFLVHSSLCRSCLLSMPSSFNNASD